MKHSIVAKLSLREVSNGFISYQTLFIFVNSHILSFDREEAPCSRICAETENVSSRNVLSGFAFHWKAYWMLMVSLEKGNSLYNNYYSNTDLIDQFRSFSMSRAIISIPVGCARSDKLIIALAKIKQIYFSSTEQRSELESPWMILMNGWLKQMYPLGISNVYAPHI